MASQVFARACGENERNRATRRWPRSWSRRRRSPPPGRRRAARPLGSSAPDRSPGPYRSGVGQVAQNGGSPFPGDRKLRAPNGKPAGGGRGRTWKGRIRRAIVLRPRPGAIPFLSLYGRRGWVECQSSTTHLTAHDCLSSLPPALSIPLSFAAAIARRWQRPGLPRGAHPAAPMVLTEQAHVRRFRRSATPPSAPVIAA